MHSYHPTVSLADSASSTPEGRSTLFSRKPPSLPILMSRLLLVTALLAQIVIAWRFQYLTWDDSAITLGFSRTFAHTGKIEPTPGSGIVEGYSTTLWMLLMAVAAKIASTPTSLLVIAKVSTLLLNLVNIILMRRWFLTWTGELCANLVAGFVGCTLMFYETINGMETPLLLTLVLVMLLLLPSPHRFARLGYLLAGSAFLLTRWEAAWLLAPFLLVESTTRRRLVSFFTWLSVFLISNLVRWRYFGSLLPNTIIAKRGAPYSPINRSVAIHQHFGEPLQILAACKLLLIVLIASLLYNRFVTRRGGSLVERIRSSFRHSWQLRFAALFFVFSLILSTAIGANWGPPQRSFYSAWPFLFCLLILPAVSNLRSRAVPWLVATICLFALLRMSVRIHELDSKQAPIYMPETTVGKIAEIDTAISDIQSASRHPNLVFAGPDMGAILLYSNGVRIVDLGLLCDPVLAHSRYGAIDSYVLQQRQPDIIEVHSNWTTITGLDHSALFRNNYRPVYVDHKRMFVRRSLIADINPARLIEKTYDNDGRPDQVDTFETNYVPSDFKLNKDFVRYLELK
jgi:hypothetical protein